MDINEELLETCKSGNLKKVQELIEEGADINYESAALWNAVVSGNINLVRYILLRKKYNIFEGGMLALLEASEKNRQDIVEEIIYRIFNDYDNLLIENEELKKDEFNSQNIINDLKKHLRIEV